MALIKLFRVLNFKMFLILNLSSFGYVLEQLSSVTLSENNWIISITGTGWKKVNLLHFPDSIEINSLEGLSLWCPEINQLK